MVNYRLKNSEKPLLDVNNPYEVRSVKMGRRLTSAAPDVGSGLIIVAVVAALVEMEHIKEVAHGRRIEWYVGIAGIDNRGFQIVAAAAGQGFQTPVTLNELYD